MQHAAGNQGMAQMLSSGAPPPAAVALRLQRAGGNLEPLTNKLNGKYEAKRVAKIKPSKNLLETANKMILKSQPKPERIGFQMSEEAQVQSAVQGLSEREYTISDLEAEYGESNPLLLETIKAAWAKANSK